MLLLDLHVVIWLAIEPDKVSIAAREATVNGGSDVYVSAVTAWEFGQKRAKRPEQLPVPLSELLAGIGVTGQSFPFEPYEDAEALPPIHADPFDRMLVAHARHLDCPIVTADKAIHRYPVKTIW